MTTITPGELRAIRESLGLTLEQLARRLDTTTNTIWRWEAGQRQIGHPAMLRLALDALTANRDTPDRLVTSSTVGDGMGTGVRMTQEYIWRNEHPDLVREITESSEAKRGEIDPSLLLAARILLDGNWGWGDAGVDVIIVPRDEEHPEQDGVGILLSWSHLGPLAAHNAGDVETAERYVAEWPAGVTARLWRARTHGGVAHEGRLAIQRDTQRALSRFALAGKTPLIALEIAPARHQLYRLLGALRWETTSCMRRGLEAERDAQERVERERRQLAAREADATSDS